jgi:hypothetical protein
VTHVFEQARAFLRVEALWLAQSSDTQACTEAQQSK